MATDLFLDHCASLEDLKAANKPSMDTQLFALRHHSPFSELTMLLHLAQSNPSLFQMVSERRMVAMKLGWPKELLEADEEEVEAKQREDWVTSYRPEITLCCDWCSKRLAGEVEGQRDVQAPQEERVNVMNGTNPQLRPQELHRPEWRLLRSSGS
uniref:Selenoprotein O1 n=1 Tax=Hucho hucho TaxID=62062 RepID=A0A4W5R454_9TELE